SRPSATIPSTSRPRRWPGAWSWERVPRRRIWSRKWRSMVTGWRWEGNVTRTAATGPLQKPGLGNEQEAAVTFGEAPPGGARPRHEGARLLRRVVQRLAPVLG